jgi:spore coat protein A
MYKKRRHSRKQLRNSSSKSGISRRDFLKATGALGAAYWLGPKLIVGGKVYAESLPGGTLEPAGIPKYQTPMLIPPVMPTADRIIERGGKNIDYYEISMRQFDQQILPAGYEATPVWGYGAVASGVRNGLLLHNAPSLTIEAKAGIPVRVKWINDLVDDNGHYLPHLLAVDPTLHWANPPQGSDANYGMGPKDSRPTFTSTPGPYTGPVPMVTHVHGAVGVGDESDGYTEAWYLPDANNIPGGYATKGTWYDFFANKASTNYGVTWGPGYATFQYPNSGRAATDWYHDHALGMTRLNVYAGPAGFYIIRGGPDGDNAVLDSRYKKKTPAVLPGPAPKPMDPFPPRHPIYEIPIAIQDRSFNEDGALFYPDSREFFDGIVDEYIGNNNGEFSPIWNPEFFGNTIMVNGNTWPFQTVEQRRYRLRFLNGCQSRFLILDFDAIPNVEVWQIGNEGGFLSTPVNLTANQGNRLLMGLAERADVIVDFTNVPLGNHVLGNVGPDEPFGGGVPGEEFDAADPDTTGQIMQFRVVPIVGTDDTTPPQYLVLPPVVPLPAETVTRQLALIEEAGEGSDAEQNEVEGPVEALLGNVNGSGETEAALWMDAVTENPAVDTTEVWEIYNTTADAHPMHVHEVKFEVVNRQPLMLNNDGEAAIPVQLDGPTRPPEPGETGFKDTVIAYPGEVTRIKAYFITPGQFVWHCHIVEHEDNEMMRPYRVGPEQPGQPS